MAQHVLTRARVFPHLIFLTLVSLAPIATSASVQVAISPVGVQQNAGSVSFDLRGGPDGITDVNVLPNSPPLETGNHRFRVYLDPNISSDKNRVLFFNIYVQSISPDANDPIYRFTFAEYPTGRFLDCKADVPVHILNGQTDEGVVTIRLPVHSVEEMDFLSANDGPPPVPVNSASTNFLEIPISNKLSDLDLLVTNVTLSTDDDQNWRAKPEVSTPVDFAHPLRIAANGTTMLKIELVPRFWRVLTNSVLPSSDVDGDDTLRLQIEYASDQGGIQRVLPSKRPLRFVNWEGAIIFGLIGALIGNVAVFFRAQNKKRTLTQFATMSLSGLATTLILELVGMFLVTNGSKFVLFNLNLDPRQLLPGFVVGVLAGIGIIDPIGFFQNLGKKKENGD